MYENISKNKKTNSKNFGKFFQKISDRPGVRYLFRDPIKSIATANPQSWDFNGKGNLRLPIYAISQPT